MRFIVIGDWGSGRDTQHRVAAAMAKFADKTRVDFILSVGDNIYPAGVTSSHDSQFLVKWKLVYNHPSLVRLRWYLVAGNHDHGVENGEELYQVEYSKRENRWIMPDLKYTFTRPIGGSVVRFVAFDSHSFIYNKSNAHQVHQQFVQSALMDPHSDWKIVFTHYPAFTAGPTYSLENTDIVNNIVPLLDRYKADLYLSGHDHNLQHLTKNGSRVDYVISGSGGFELYPLSAINLQEMNRIGVLLKRMRATHGFVVVNITPGMMSVEFVDVNGIVFYTFNKRKNTRKIKN